MKASIWKTMDCVSYALIIVGALNWGLVGFFNFNLVSALFGTMTVLSRIVYGLVGVAALYDVVAMPEMIHRWHVPLHHEPDHAHA